MFKIKANTAPCIFQKQFTEIHHQYSTRFSKNSFVKSQLVYSQTKFFVSSRRPRVWNKLLDLLILDKLLNFSEFSQVS